MTTISLRFIGDRKPFKINQINGIIKSGVQQGAALIRSDWMEHGQHYSGGIGIEQEILEDQATVGTSDRRVEWNTYGTRPHVIRARPGGSLAFQTGYTAKTAINTIPSNAGGPHGPTVFAKIVNHPGTQARHTDQAIAAHVEQPIAQIFNRLLQGIT